MSVGASHNVDDHELYIRRVRSHLHCTFLHCMIMTCGKTKHFYCYLWLMLFQLCAWLRIFLQWMTEEGVEIVGETRHSKVAVALTLRHQLWKQKGKEIMFLHLLNLVDGCYASPCILMQHGCRDLHYWGMQWGNMQRFSCPLLVTLLWFVSELVILVICCPGGGGCWQPRAWIHCSCNWSQSNKSSGPFCVLTSWCLGYSAMVQSSHSTPLLWLLLDLTSFDHRCFLLRAFNSFCHVWERRDVSGESKGRKKSCFLHLP